MEYAGAVRIVGRVDRGEEKRVRFGDDFDSGGAGVICCDGLQEVPD